MFKFKKILLSAIILMSSSSAFATMMDTTNRKDSNNKKQGHWVYTNQMKKLPDYRAEQIVEEGDYTDDRKTGKWIFYFNNDKVKHILTYTNNRPNGYAIFYYKNGQKKEEGTWKNNKWVGEYKYYYNNGNLRNDWKYNKSGKRTGVQKYYHENGQLKIEGSWSNGKEAGIITEYFIDGSVKSERVFNNGEIDAIASKKFNISEKPGKVTTLPIVKKAKKTPSIITTKKAVIPVKSSPWNGTGERSFLNKKGKVIRKGDFENGYLINGVVYMYGANGKKIRTTYYKGGRMVRVENHTDATPNK